MLPRLNFTSGWGESAVPVLETSAETVIVSPGEAETGPFTWLTTRSGLIRATGVGVFVGVLVTVTFFVGVFVGVLVTVTFFVGVFVGVLVTVTFFVGVFVGVLVRVGVAPPCFTTSKGRERS